MYVYSDAIRAVTQMGFFANALWLNLHIDKEATCVNLLLGLRFLKGLEDAHDDGYQEAHAASYGDQP